MITSRHWGDVLETGLHMDAVGPVGGPGDSGPLFGVLGGVRPEHTNPERLAKGKPPQLPPARCRPAWRPTSAVQPWQPQLRSTEYFTMFRVLFMAAAANRAGRLRRLGTRDAGEVQG